MTTEEHKLMITMFATQLATYAALVETLRKKGVLTPEDLAVLDQESRRAGASNEIFSAARVQYVAHAKLLGLDENLPE